jgi:hypothetical protein
LAGLTANEVQQARWNSLDAAFLSSGEKERIRKKYKTES